MIIQNKKSNLLFLLPSILWMALITYLSSRSELPDMQQLFLNADKAAHFLVYFILGILLYIGIKINLAKNNMFCIIITFLIGSCFAIIDEYHQSFVPNRVPDFLDFIADILGLSLSLLLNIQIKQIFTYIFKKIHFNIEF